MEAWTALIGRHTDSPEAEDVGRRLLASWREPHRRYHAVCHPGHPRRVEELQRAG